MANFDPLVAVLRTTSSCFRWLRNPSNVGKITRGRCPRNKQGKENLSLSRYDRQHHGCLGNLLSTPNNQNPDTRRPSVTGKLCPPDAVADPSNQRAVVGVSRHDAFQGVVLKGYLIPTGKRIEATGEMNSLLHWFDFDLLCKPQGTFR